MLVRLYVDGALQSSKAIALNTILDANGLTIGVRPGTTNIYWTGYLDEVRVYGRALSTSEIGALAASP